MMEVDDQHHFLDSDVDSGGDYDEDFDDDDTRLIHNFVWDTQLSFHVTSQMIYQQQSAVSPTRYHILFDWLVEVAEEFHVSAEVLHLTNCYCNRFLAQKSVSLENFQLLGIVCMLLALKFHTVSTDVNVDALLYISDNQYSNSQMLQYERLVIDALEWRLCQPTSWWFLTLYWKRWWQYLDHQQKRQRMQYQQAEDTRKVSTQDDERLKRRL